MINEINLNYYRPSYFTDFVRAEAIPDGVSDTDPIGKCCGDIWAYYYPDNPDNADYLDKPLNTSLYLWNIAPTASAACNACLSIAPDINLSAEVKINQTVQPVPLAMCLYNLGGNSDSGLRNDPKIRLAYDKTTNDYWNSHYGGWQKSVLMYDINPLKYCILPDISVFDFDANSTATTTLAGLPAYINIDPDNRRVCLISSTIYCGDEYPRTSSAVYSPDTGIIAGLDAGILSDRPLCDNLANTVGAWIRDAEDAESYDITKVYNPFNQWLTRPFYSGTGYDTSRQLDIGYYLSAERQDYTGGHYDVPNSHGKCTAEFCHISYNVQSFDDVVYQWRHCTYYSAVNAEIDNGFPLTSYGTDTSNIVTMSVLEILDAKDAATYGEACKRAVLHELAFIGFWIAETADKAANDPLGTTTTGAGIYLPEKIGGVTTGRYFTGDDIKNVPYAGATDTSPFKYTPEESDSDSGDLETVIQRGNVSGGLWYTLEQNQLSNLTSWLNTTYRPTEAELTEDFKGVNPSDFIISLKYYPFKIQDSAAVNDVTLGGLDTGIDAPFLTRLYGQGAGYYDLGSFTFEPPYIAGNWTDSYNKILLYVPWCGFAELDAATFCQSPDNSYNTLHVTMQIDFATGCCTAYIYRNITMIDSLSGTVGVDIPLSAAAQGSYQTAIKQAEIAVKQSKMNMLAAHAGLTGAIGAAAAGVASGNPLLAAAGVLGVVNASKNDAAAQINVESAEYTLNHTAPHIGNIESAAPFNGCISDQTAKVYIFRPATLAGADLTTYGNTVGFACCKSGKLSDFHGLTVCSNVKLDAIDAPAHHKAAIQQALIKGVYLP